MNRSRAFCLMTAIFLLFSAFGLPACQKQSYGDVFSSLELLQEKMRDQSLAFPYPAYLGEAAENAEREFIAVKDPKAEGYNGYKIYQFGSPFFTSVTAYSFESDTLMSDESARMEAAGALRSNYGEITVFQGKGHKDALFLIGLINIDGAHYEIRVTSDEDMTNNVYTHAIYEENEYHQQALDLIVSIVNSLQVF